MQHYWFKPKRYGYGAAPSSWQGWVATVIYVVVMFGLSGWLATGNGQNIIAFCVLALIVTIIFVVLAWRTTEGGWRWRWGDKDRN
jgi:hypothetical protein